MKTVRLPPDSKIEIIDKYALAYTSLKIFNCPLNIIKIAENALYMCTFLQKFEIQQNSKLQIIEKQTFYGTSIEKITISHFISNICEESFINCHNFQRIFRKLAKMLLHIHQ